MAEVGRWLVLHHDDPDGWCAAAVVGAYAVGSIDGVRRGIPSFREVSYGLKLDDLDIEGFDEIWMVDFSMPITDMKRIKEATGRFVWIDHHESAIRNVVEAGFETDGIQENGGGGCQLTWEYCFDPNNVLPQPAILTRIGGFDIGNFSRVNLKMMFGFLGRGNSLHPSEFDTWAKLFDDVGYDELDSEGSLILRYKEAEWAKLGPHIVTLEWEGYTWAVLNSRELGSLQIEPHMRKEWDGALVYSRGSDGWRVGFRGFKEGIDVSRIAEKYGGGGHKLAAGISGGKRLPFENELELGEDLVNRLVGA